MTNKEFWEMRKAYEMALEEDLEKLYFDLEDNYNAYMTGKLDFSFSDAWVEVKIPHTCGEITSWYFQVTDRAKLKDIAKYILAETRFHEVTIFTANHDAVPTFRSVSEIERDFEKYCN